MSFDNRIFVPGHFKTVRTLATVAADSATINDTNFPPTSAFAATGARSIWIVWHGTGGTSADTIKIVPLVRDGINNVWNLMTEVTLVKDTLLEVFTYGAAQVYLRISLTSATTATALTVNVAIADAERVQ